MNDAIYEVRASVYFEGAYEPEDWDVSTHSSYEDAVKSAESINTVEDMLNAVGFDADDFDTPVEMIKVYVTTTKHIKTI